MEPGDRRELTKGFGDSLSRAFELVLTPVIFGAIGWFVDDRTGTRPLFTLLLFMLVLSYLLWKMYMRYDADMRAHEARLVGRMVRRDPHGDA
ncbi:MAG: AtpZ/AtpI family protein [Acidimicrobiia bacterium]